MVVVPHGPPFQPDGAYSPWTMHCRAPCLAAAESKLKRKIPRPMSRMPKMSSKKTDRIMAPSSIVAPRRRLFWLDRITASPSTRRILANHAHFTGGGNLQLGRNPGPGDDRLEIFVIGD